MLVLQRGPGARLPVLCCRLLGSGHGLQVGGAHTQTNTDQTDQTELQACALPMRCIEGSQYQSGPVRLTYIGNTSHRKAVKKLRCEYHNNGSSRQSGIYLALSCLCLNLVLPKCNLFCPPALMLSPRLPGRGQGASMTTWVAPTSWSTLPSSACEASCTAT